MTTPPTRHRLPALPAATLCAIICCITLALTACGSGENGFKGTWLRTDDHQFVLTITRPQGGDYTLAFENRANGLSQTIGGIVRPNATLQAAFEVPQEPAGALAAGPPDMIAITLRIEDGVIVVRTGGDGPGAETVLWKYERAAE